MFVIISQLVYTVFSSLREQERKMEQSTEQLKKRFIELSIRSDRANQFVFTDFLSLAEQSILHEALFYEPNAHFTCFGGIPDAERVMVRFGDSESLGYEEPFPVVCLMIKPLITKFAEDLSHRDYLGAFMSLGIDRSLIGDILVKEKQAYVFVADRIAPYICEQIDSIRHTHVSCTVYEGQMEAFAPTLQTEEHIVSSLRLDGIVAKLYHLSRSQSLALFSKQKVFVNGRLFENNSGALKEGDIVSVRGFGRFRFDGKVADTKKGKLRIRVARYI